MAAPDCSLNVARDAWAWSLAALAAFWSGLRRPVAVFAAPAAAETCEHAMVGDEGQMCDEEREQRDGKLPRLPSLVQSRFHS